MSDLHASYIFELKETASISSVQIILRVKLCYNSFSSGIIFWLSLTSICYCFLFGLRV